MRRAALPPASRSGDAQGARSAEFPEERRVVGHETVAAQSQETAHQAGVVHRPEQDEETETMSQTDTARGGQADVRMYGVEADLPVQRPQAAQRAGGQETDRDVGHRGACLPEGPRRE